jgi:hypothetical protein
MPEQVQIKHYFPTDKAIEPPSTRAAPAGSGTTAIPPVPPIPPTPSVPAVPPDSATLPPAVLPSLKRRGSKTLLSNSKQKHLRTGAATSDGGALTASAEPDDDFPDGPVKVWAMTRSDLCSSQQAFKQYQSGVQSKNNVVTAVYVNKFTEPRDLLARNKLITCM